MKKQIPLLLLATVVALSVRAAEPEITRAETNRLNRFGADVRVGFNITARFKNLGRLSLRPNTRTTPNDDNYNYDDGYVLTDVSGNFGGQTWYWGYDGPDQISGDTILMSRSRALGGSASPFGTREEDPQLGAEFTYNRELGTCGKVRWGIEAAVNYMNVCFDDRSSFAGGVMRTTDAYPFTPGTTPPQTPPPYQGNYDGPGFVIGDTPVSSSTRFVAKGATVTGQRELEANIWGFRLGPYADFPIGTRWNFSLSAGLTLGLVDATASWNERVAIGSTTIATSRGRGDDVELLWGAYASAKASYRLSEHWSVEAGAQFQMLGSYEKSLGGRKVELDLGKSIFAVAGFSYSF